jgi:hypothetical protein
MKRLTILAIIACVGLLVGSAAVIGAPSGPPEGLDVNVVNPVPLPVTGSVNVVNGVANPEPLQVDLIDFPSGYTVPNNRLLVIKYVSGQFNRSNGEVLEAYIEISDPGVRHHFVPVLIGVDGPNSHYSFSQQTHIYASPGSTVDIGFEITGAISISDFVISGELVPMPSTP